MLTSHVENHKGHAPYLKPPHLDVNPKVNLNLNLIPKDCEDYNNNFPREAWAMEGRGGGEILLTSQPGSQQGSQLASYGNLIGTYRLTYGPMATYMLQ